MFLNVIFFTYKIAGLALTPEVTGATCGLGGPGKVKGGHRVEPDCLAVGTSGLLCEL